MSLAKQAAAAAFIGVLGFSWSVSDACYFAYRREARTEVRETKPVAAAPVVQQRTVVEQRPVAGPPPAEQCTTGVGRPVAGPPPMETREYRVEERSDSLNRGSDNNNARDAYRYEEKTRTKMDRDGNVETKTKAKSHKRFLFF